ncbi:MAG: hypothetical protein RBT41_01170 [Clostridia bacterium]|nr:hypothetical protein [Clostridia bacterium]
MLDMKSWFWPLYILVFFIPTLLFIPRREYKGYFLYGFILGGMVDILTIVLLGNILGMFMYSDGPLVVQGIPIFIPIAFTFTWMLFLYFLPVQTTFLVVYITGFSGFAVLLGFVLQNLGYFTYSYGFTLSAFINFISFLLWFSLSAWIYRRNELKRQIIK